MNVWQSFLYDKVNRLTSAIETPTSGSSTPPWTQIYDYDTSGFGNRWLDPASSGLSLSPFTPQYSTNFNANNQLVVQSSTYDTAGNQKTIGGFSYNYDAENRVSLVTEPSGTNPPSYQYFYDGAGRRIQKVASGGTTTTYVYDAAGEIAAEYSSTASTPNCSTCFVVQDTLGSTRLMFDATTGNPVALHDYLPFGEELVNVRPSLLYSGNDNPRQKFTGKERDSETSLDYFGARYFSGAQGRFTSVDPSYESEILEFPQTWNRYAYVHNRPLVLRDPDGRCPVCIIVGAGAVGAAWDLGTQLYNNGGDFDQVSWREVGATATGDMVAATAVVLTGGGSLFAEGSAAVLGNMGGGSITRTLEGQETTGADLFVDGLSGLAGYGGSTLANGLIHVPNAPEPLGVRRHAVGRRALARYDAAVNRRQSALQTRAVAGTAAGGIVTHAMSTIGGNFWAMMNWLVYPQDPTPTPKSTPKQRTPDVQSTFIPCTGGGDACVSK